MVRDTTTDAEWYLRKDFESDRFYDIFFMICRKYNISWAKATETEKNFVEELTRVAYERDRAVRFGFALSEIRPSFT